MDMDSAWYCLTLTSIDGQVCDVRRSSCQYVVAPKANLEHLTTCEKGLGCIVCNLILVYMYLERDESRYKVSVHFGYMDKPCINILAIHKQE